jgi:hypothetical protein
MEYSIIEDRVKTIIQTPNLSNDKLMSLFGEIFPLVYETGSKGTSGCWVITGHGNDLDIRDRPQILYEMVKLHPDFDNSNDIRNLTNYIKNNVSLTMAMGLPGPSAPMREEVKEGRWAGLTTSEIDVQIIRNIYQLFNKYIGNKIVTNDMLDVLNYIVKQQLRANFIQLWGPDGEYRLKTKGRWEADIVRLMRSHEIWVTKKIKPDSADRYYQLRPNIGEDIEFRAKEGLHLIDMRDSHGIEIANLVLAVSEYNDASGNFLPIPNEFDKNNIQFPEARSRLEHYFYNILNVIRESKEDIVFKLIIGNIFSKTEPNVYLSEIIMLGYILQINKLQIYDPLCRPMEDESIKASTRSKENYRGQIPAKEAAEFDTFPREGSEKVLQRIKKKCVKPGTCAVMGGKIKLVKKSKLTKKVKSKKYRKRSRKNRHTRK